MQARHIYICDYHKGVIQSARSKRRRKDSEEDSNETDTDIPEVDMFQLQVNTLRRYKRHFKVATRPGLNKAQLADVSRNIYSYSVSYQVCIKSLELESCWKSSFSLKGCYLSAGVIWPAKQSVGCSGNSSRCE